MLTKIVILILVMLLAQCLNVHAQLDGNYRGSAHGFASDGTPVEELDGFTFAGGQMTFMGTAASTFYVDVLGVHADYCWWTATPCVAGHSLAYNLLFQGFINNGDSCGDGNGFILLNFDGCNDDCGAVEGCTNPRPPTEFAGDMVAIVTIGASRGYTEFDYMFNESRAGDTPVNMVGHAVKQ